MLVVGQVSSKEEAKEIEFIAKMFVVGIRARKLGHDAFIIKQLDILKNMESSKTSLDMEEK